MISSPPVLIVTGGGRGIGAATARLAARRGYAVCINYLHDQEAAETVAREIEGTGRRAIAVQADVGSEQDVIHLFARVDIELGRPDVLINNAALLEMQMRLEEVDAPRLHRIFATNSIGPILCAREAVRRMSTRRGG